MYTLSISQVSGAIGVSADRVAMFEGGQMVGHNFPVETTCPCQVNPGAPSLNVGKASDAAVGTSLSSRGWRGRRPDDHLQCASVDGVFDYDDRE